MASVSSQNLIQDNLKDRIVAAIKEFHFTSEDIARVELVLREQLPMGSARTNYANFFGEAMANFTTRNRSSWNQLGCHLYKGFEVSVFLQNRKTPAPNLTWIQDDVKAHSRLLPRRFYEHM